VPAADRLTIAANVVLFQVGWFACVLGAARGMAWVGPAAVAAIVAWHLARAGRAAPEAGLVAVAMLVGAAFDTLLARSGTLEFRHGMLADRTAPVWMVAMWANFATTLNVSLRWLRGRPWIAALAGAVGGPLAYMAGARLGAVELASAGAALAAVAVGWAIVTPLLVRLAARLDGFRPS